MAAELSEEARLGLRFLEVIRGAGVEARARLSHEYAESMTAGNAGNLNILLAHSPAGRFVQ